MQPDEFFMTRVIPQKAVYVTGLRVAARAAGGHCQLALYDNVVGVFNNRPGKRLAFANDLVIAEGMNEGAPNVPVMLTAGQLYWVGGSCKLEDGGAFDTFWKEPYGSQVAEEVWPFTQPPPESFPVTADVVAGQAYSFALGVLDVPDSQAP